MASESPSPRFLRVMVVLAVTAAAVGLSPGAGGAEPSAPTTCAESRAQFSQNSEQAEQIAEKFNDARVLRSKVQREYVAARQKAGAVQDQVGLLSADFRRLVANEVQAAPAGHMAMVFSSTSPKDFVDQLALMDYIAGRKGEKIDRLAVTRAGMAKAQAVVQGRLTAQRKVENEISARRSELKRRGETLQALQSRLCEPARAEIRASRGADRTPVALGGSPSAAARKAVETALAQRGDPYSWGAGGPGAFDCSGLTMFAWAAAGVSLAHSSATQSQTGTPVPRSAVQAGDLVAFYSPVHHIGIAINNREMVHASTYGQPVQVALIDDHPFTSATRVG